MYVRVFELFLDTKSAEYEVFIQYYNKLMPSLKNCTNQLYECCWEYFNSDFHHIIKNYVDEVINEDATKAGMWVARIAMKLYYDNTKSFYRMLKFMESYNEDSDVQQLAAEIRTKVKEFDPLMSSGMVPLKCNVAQTWHFLSSHEYVSSACEHAYFSTIMTLESRYTSYNIRDTIVHTSIMCFSNFLC